MMMILSKLLFCMLVYISILADLRRAIYKQTPWSGLWPVIEREGPTRTGPRLHPARTPAAS